MRKSLILILFLVFTFSLTAQDKETEALKKRISSLEKRVERLEKMLGTKARLPFRKTTSVNKKEEKAKPKYTFLTNWRRLKIGMKDTTVKRILGEPVRITEGRYTAIWWYEWQENRRYRIGHVAFDHRKKLILWVEP